MAYLVHVARFGFSALLTLSVAGACGGQSFGNGDGGGATGAGPHGGSNAQAGSGGAGGKGTAGSSSKAGSSAGGSGTIGGTGSGGGSTVGPECSAPPESGNCEAYFPSWYHDPTNGVCKPFVYGGCGGNENRYDSLEACQKACRGNQPDYDSCTRASDCVVSGAGCCADCDGPNKTKHDFVAYNRKYTGGVYTCPDILCGPCPELQPGTGTRANFIADCVNNQCTVIDIRETALTECTVSDVGDECRLRHGNHCCEGCGPDSDLIAVRNDGSFEKHVCGTEPVGCPACAPVPPLDLVAVCDSGRCVLGSLTATH